MRGYYEVWGQAKTGTVILRMVIRGKALEVGIKVVGSCMAVIIDHDEMLMVVSAHSVTTRKSRGRRVEGGGRL
jgi:hypothetical protein